MNPEARQGKALDRLMKGKTSIVIAHHLVTIRRAKIIFVVKDNTLVECGAHHELLASGGLYLNFLESNSPMKRNHPPHIGPQLAKILPTSGKPVPFKAGSVP